MAVTPTRTRESIAQRHLCDVPTTCQPPSGWGTKDPWPAVIREIAVDSLSLALSRRFERGAGLAIELPADDGTTSTILARVTQIDSDNEGGWVLGCSFISELSEDEVQSVLKLDAIHQGGLPEDGNAPAQPTINGVLFQARLGHGEYLRFYIKQLGIGEHWPLPQGKEVRLHIAAPGADTAPLELRVKACQPFGSIWVVNCKALVRPSDETIQALSSTGM